ncbi:MAG: HNH endonuclease [Actinobacteria bacterium]|nr:HNH endonuclease [Actinomycetota bacterium]
MGSGSLTATVASGSVESFRDLDDAALEAAMADLRVAMARLEAAHSLMLGEVERRGLPALSGFGSTTGWLIARSGDPAGVCRSRVGVARALPHMPRTREVFSRGGLSEPRVRMLARAWETNPEAFERDEATLMSHAGNLHADGFGHLLRHWGRLADHEGHLREARRAYQARRLWASVTWDGSVRIDGDLDPEGGATVITALGSMVDPTYRDPNDPRSPAQRRADALVEICRRHLDDTLRPTIGGERPHLTLTVDLDTLQNHPGGACDLDPVGPIPPQDARRVGCDATITTLATRGGQPFSVARATRIVSGPLRRALAARDHHCTHPGCTTPAAWCDAHHIHHWADGGPTRLDNLQLLCRRHHRLTHHQQE